LILEACHERTIDHVPLDVLLAHVLRPGA
jgi:hypothetical protein